MARGIMEAFVRDAGYAEHVFVDSAGTHACDGRPPEKFAIEAASSYGSDILAYRSRAVAAVDFERFDRLVAMDLDNLDYLRLMSPDRARSKVELLLGYAPELHLTEVPDPYGCKLKYFQYVAELIATGSQGLLDRLIGEGARTLRRDRPQDE